MTRNEVIVRAIAGEITWIQAAMICGITARHMRQLKERYQKYGYDGLVDGRGGRPRRKRISVGTIEKLCKLKREKYADFSVRHFWEKASEEHGLAISYTWARLALQAAGLAEKSLGRGRYRRKRQRRAMRGMLVHLDGSTHEWIEGLPMWDLIVALDDADGRILYARFVRQEGTLSSLAALKHVLRTHGRFCELYTDRGSHFCRTAKAGGPATTEHDGQVSGALKVLGIRQILARSPQARGRSERAFGTIQGRLPQELRLAGIRDSQPYSTNFNHSTKRTSLTVNDPDLFNCQRQGRERVGYEKVSGPFFFSRIRGAAPQTQRDIFASPLVSRGYQRRITAHAA